MSIKINNDNYDLYKKIFDIILNYMHKNISKALKDKGLESLENLNANWETSNKSLNKKMLQSGINDTISSLKYYSEELRLKINEELGKEKLPSINTLLNIVNDSINKVLLKKKISNIDQYYIVRELFDNTESDITPEQLENLSQYILEFEIRKKL